MGVINYNADSDKVNAPYIVRATNGGTTFSGNIATSSSFDYFDDSPTVDDAIYFAYSALPSSNLYLHIGTALAGTNVVLAWEYLSRTYYSGSWHNAWRSCYGLTDNSSGLTVTGDVLIRYPQQPTSYVSSAGGISVNWIRCRLVSFDSITEGGANSTSRVQVNKGLLRLTDYTESSPCSLEDVYTWINSNAPEIGAYKWGNAYKIDNCNLYVDSTLRTTGEVLFLGNGCYYQRHNFSYLYAGNKVGTDGWKNPTYIFLCTLSPTSTFANASTTKIYGGCIDTENWYNEVDGLTCLAGGGYAGMQHGEYLGAYLPKTGYFYDAVSNKCIIGGNLITTSDPSIYPNNLIISDPKNAIWAIYGNGLNVENVDYAMPTTALIIYNGQYSNQDQVVNIDNSTAIESGIRVAERSLGSTDDNVTKAFYYDDSAGTYTDYTTEINNDTANDVPLSGDVGDCLYFIFYNVQKNGSQPALIPTVPTQTNDYEYVWEQYETTGWHTITSDCIFDNSENFTKSGEKIYIGTDGASFSTTTINGTSGYWMRLRIVTKGTGSPVLSRLKCRRQTGIGNYVINLRYSTDFTITNFKNEPIENATVEITDSTGTKTTLLTDSDGKTTTTKFAYKKAAFDGTESDAHWQIKETSLNPYTLTVKKAGYTTYSESFNLTEKLNNTIAIKPIMSYGFIE